MGLDKILVLDDELVIRKALEEQLRRKRYAAVSVGTIAEAEKYLARDEFDLLFLDVHLPDGDGTALLERLSKQPNSPLVVMITGYATVESAVSCMRAGAFDYIIKPFSMSQIDVLLKKAESFSQLVKVNQFFSEESASGPELIGASPAMVKLKQLIQKVAPTEATVLINGENGTGKELVANELYRTSTRRKAPFIRVNCAAISESLIESEFFGHEKGAFTGALNRREGRFELANNGTILLDEISEISPKVQAKLLRVLQEREFERVGGNKTIKVNVRVIATTNRDLLKSVERNEFRQDLYYRLNVFPVHVPPLRERKADIPELAKAFVERFSRKHGIKVRGISDEAMQVLLGNDWPGNVRELQNMIERAVILTESGRPLGASSLGLFAALDHPTPAAVSVPGPDKSDRGANELVYGEPNDSSPPPPRATGPVGSPSAPVPPVSSSNGAAEEEALPLQEVEKRHILSVLKQTGGNRTQATALLGISIRTLRNKLTQYRQEGEVIDGDD